MKRIKITRHNASHDYYYGLKLFVDGESIGRIATEQTIEISVTDDASNLEGRFYLAKTTPFDLSRVEAGDHIDLIIPQNYSIFSHLGLVRLKWMARVRPY